MATNRQWWELLRKSAEEVRRITSVPDLDERGRVLAEHDYEMRERQ